MNRVENLDKPRLVDRPIPDTIRETPPEVLIRIEVGMTKSLQSKCLLASPHMEDGNFYRSAVLVLRHTTEDALGVILNRPTDYSLKQVVSMVCEGECVHDGVLHCGGPVDGPLIAIHDCSELSAFDCFPGLYFSTDQSQLLQLFADESATFKLFDGFAGWGPGQLDREIEEGGWLISDISPEEALASNGDLWDDLTRRLGHEILTAGGLVREVPVDPQWN